MSQSELDRLMEQITSKYDVEILPMTIGNRKLKTLQLKDFESYIEKVVEADEDIGLANLPFWAKVWEASLILAYFMGKQPVVPGRRILEVGAGLGIVGVYAALCGHRVTISDYNDDALLFARANALINNLPDVEIRNIDWNDQGFSEQYDVIIGSEIVYDRRGYPILVDFLKRALAPDGMVFMSKNAEMKTPAFFEELTKHFELKQNIQKMKTGEGDQEFVLYAIRTKGCAADASVPRGAEAMRASI